MVVGLCGSGAFATIMGPPVADLKAGQFIVGFDYSNNDIGADINAEKASLYSLEVYNDDGKRVDDIEISEGPEKLKLSEEIDIDMRFVKLGYGVCDKLEVFLRLGTADFEVIDMRDFSKFSYGFGAKATFYEEGNLKLGALFQMTWAEADGEFLARDVRVRDEEENFDVEEFPVGDVPVTWEADYYQLKFAVGPTYELSEVFSIYGGPFYHLISGNLEREYNRIDLYDSISNEQRYFLEQRYFRETSGDIEESSSFGGYVGAQIDIDERLPLYVEYQFTGDADVLGISLVCRF